MIKKRPRINAIDLLRGFFIFVMTVDHIARFPNGLDLISGRNLLWFSAAEGFVATSGLLVGYIYAPKILHHTKDVCRKLLRRALILYICVIAMATLFIVWSYFAFKVTDISYIDHPLELAWQLLTLHYSYGWAEFLTHYVVFLLIAPAALWLIAKRYTWLVFLLSFVVWLTHLWSAAEQSRYDFTASWQFLFVCGMIIGTHLLDIKTFIQSRIKPKQLFLCYKILWVVALVLFLTSSFFAYGMPFVGSHVSVLSGTMAHIQAAWQPINDNAVSWLTNKSTLGPLRLAFGTVIFAALFTLFQTYYGKINQLTGGVLELLGKRPLIAYCLGAIIIFIIEKYVPQPAEHNRYFVADLFVTITALVLTYMATKNGPKLVQVIKQSLSKRASK